MFGRRRREPSLHPGDIDIILFTLMGMNAKLDEILALLEDGEDGEVDS